MLKTETRYLLVHGTEDKSVPVESARLAVEEFERNAPERLEYCEKEGLDHSLTDKSGKSYLMETLERSIHWLFR
jgi:dipeptidyl aminopeptidase/acylaminoacyl peptidase